MKPQPAIRKITDHPINPRWNQFYECPSASRKDTSYNVATNDSEEWGCSCPRWKFKRKECKHIMQVKLFIVFAEERGEDIAPVTLGQMPQKTQKAVSRFSLVEI
jgi:hypothetical protein